MITAKSNDTCRNLGENILSYAKLSNLSRFELANDAGVDPRLLKKLKEGEANPELQTLMRISTSLHVPLSVLFEEAPVDNDNFPLALFQPSFDRLSRSEQGNAIAIIKILFKLQ